jgi:hypothetical protein
MRKGKTLSWFALILGAAWAVVGTFFFFGVSPQSPPSDIRALVISTIIWRALVVGGIVGLIVFSIRDKQRSAG